MRETSVAWHSPLKVTRRQDELVREADYTLIAKYAKMGAKCEKRTKCIAGYFASLFLLFAFRENSKDFVVYFFAALMKHGICLKCEKCTVSVSYFVVFRKNIREIRNVYSRPKGQLEQ